MLLKQILLKNFRNFSLEKFNFNPFLTIIVGENAKGKTNILEAIHLIIKGIGFRESRESELIRFEAKSSEVVGIFSLEDENFVYQIFIVKNSNREGTNNTGVKKIFSINKSKKTFSNYIKETASLVLFQPEQIEIITGSPEKRRNFFDKLVGSFDPEYKKRLVNYEAALRKRNKILEIYKDSSRLKEKLSFWDDYLEENGSYLTERRQGYINFLNKNNQIDNKQFLIYYLKNEFNRRRLNEFSHLEQRFRKTVIGPQKDDFQLFQVQKSQKKNIHLFGSRSEQRLAVFWLKFNEIKYFEENLKSKPLLLLDDIFSELDIRNKKLVIDLVKKYQTLVTTTEIKLIELADIPKSIVKL